MKNPFLIGNKIYLRSLELEDLSGNYVSWLNDPEVCRYNSHHFFQYTNQKAINYISKINNSFSEIVLAIILSENNLHVGNISLQNINLINRSAELAILIGDKNYWGKGIAKSSIKLLLDHGFLSLNLHRIYLGTPRENVSMQKIAIYFGMKNEGVKRDAFFKNGEFFDILDFAILQNEYLKKNN